MIIGAPGKNIWVGQFLGEDEAPQAPSSSAVGARIQVPKAPKRVECVEGVFPSLPGEGSGEWAQPPPQEKCLILALNMMSFGAV